MKSIIDDLYESFKRNLESVNGNCMCMLKVELGKVIIELFKEYNVDLIFLFEFFMLKEVGVVFFF